MRNKQLPAVWTAHLPDKTKEEKKAKEEFEAYIRNSRGVFDRAIEIIETYIEAHETSPEDYDCPSWANKQADRNGWNRALKKVKQLFA
jgi:hypothetical protein|tara:strand:- start:105 stop:368 length:264 start_codon:yes stop_codon:yes gene_type:complete